jgi:hypothetical protein
LSKGHSLQKERIAPRYKDLDEMLNRYLQVSSEKIIISAYPQVNFDENGKLCKRGNTGMDLHPIFGMNNKETFSKSRSFVAGFHGIMERAIKDLHWRFADQHDVQTGAPNNFENDAVGIGHGICAAGPDYSPEGKMKFPRLILGTSSPFKWTSFQPQSFNPYSPRNRWFVTPNDSFLMANYHDSEMEYVYDPVQPVYAATLSGSFHPNALGHAAIADSVLAKMREALPDYEN